MTTTADRAIRRVPLLLLLYRNRPDFIDEILEVIVHVLLRTSVLEPKSSPLNP